MNVVQGKKIILVIASEGFQPIEYLITKKALEKVGVIVITASDKLGGAVATDRSTTPVDISIDQIRIQDYNGIFFIGGSGTLTCLDHSISYHILAQAKKYHIPYGAICIATRILAKADVLNGKKATGWNGDNALDVIFKLNHVLYQQDKDIVTDGLVVTATGPHVAQEFAQGIIRVLTKKELHEEDSNNNKD